MPRAWLYMTLRLLMIGKERVNSILKWLAPLAHNMIRDDRLSVASQGENQDENIVEEKDISAPDHELLSVEKSEAAADVSNTSDHPDGVGEVLQRYSDDRDASPVKWDTDASEVHPSVDAGAIEVDSNSPMQNGISEKRNPSDEAVIPQKETVVREQVNEEKSVKEKPTAGRPSSSRVAYTKSSIPLKAEQRSSFAIDISPSRKGHLIGQPRNDVSSSATSSSLVNLASKTESSRDVTKSVPSQVLGLSRPSSAPLILAPRAQLEKDALYISSQSLPTSQVMVPPGNEGAERTMMRLGRGSHMAWTADYFQSSFRSQNDCSDIQAGTSGRLSNGYTADDLPHMDIIKELLEPA
ncbi:hypothetical protein MLD38_003714 [Melastoma candidum]|uniref:Uncharacterized protein n=1 Tax=Melastoma candidum TaxID=119954 RepID=A0ACB9S3R1_9MYRT|nr:hypothetical protein MLD38_003714 [Melastoma candidum]